MRQVPITELSLKRSIKSESARNSQPDLLALNSEISRMAKELRMQMMDLWTFRGNNVLEMSKIVLKINITPY